MKQQLKYICLIFVIILFVCNFVSGADIKDYNENQIKDYYSQLNEQLSSGSGLSPSESKGIIDYIKAGSGGGSYQRAKQLDQYSKLKTELFNSVGIKLPEGLANKVSIYNINRWDMITISKVPRDPKTDIHVRLEFIEDTDNLEINKDGDIILNGANIKNSPYSGDELKRAIELTKGVDPEDGKQVWMIDGEADIDITNMDKNMKIVSKDSLVTLGDKKFKTDYQTLVSSDENGNIDVEGQFLMDYVDENNIGNLVTGKVHYQADGKVFLGEDSKLLKGDGNDALGMGLNYMIGDKNSFKIESSNERIQILGKDDDLVDGAYMKINDKNVDLGNIQSEVKISIKGEPFEDININNVNGEGSIEIDKDGVKIKFNPDGRFTTTGELSDFPQMNQKLGDHEINIQPTENGCSIQRCSECKEVGKAYQRLNSRLSEKYKLSLTEGTIVTDAYVTPDGVEVYRTNDNGETYVFDKEGNLYYAQGEDEFKKFNSETGKLESFQTAPGVMSQILTHEIFSAKEGRIPVGTSSITPSVDVRMRNYNINSVGGQIVVDKDGKQDYYEFNSESGKYEKVSPGIFLRESISPQDFDRLLRSSDKVEVIPYKYDLQEDPKAGPHVSITDSLGQRIGSIEKAPIDRTYMLKDSKGKVIGNYRTIKEAQLRIESQALHEWTQYPKIQREDIQDNFNTQGSIINFFNNNNQNTPRFNVKVNQQTLNQFNYEGTGDYLSGLTQTQGSQLLSLQNRYGLRFVEGSSKSNDIIIYDSRGNIVSQRFLFMNKRWADQVISDINDYYR